MTLFHSYRLSDYMAGSRSYGRVYLLDFPSTRFHHVNVVCQCTLLLIEQRQHPAVWSENYNRGIVEAGDRTLDQRSNFRLLPSQDSTIIPQAPQASRPLRIEQSAGDEGRALHDIVSTSLR